MSEILLLKVLGALLLALGSGLLFVSLLGLEKTIRAEEDK